MGQWGLILVQGTPVFMAWYILEADTDIVNQVRMLHYKSWQPQPIQRRKLFCSFCFALFYLLYSFHEDRQRIITEY
jgi:hypothetical protein